MKEILENPWIASVIIFTTQILMLYFRTLNIIFTTNKQIFGAVWTNNAVAITWLMSMTIGLNSMINGQWQPILGFLIGGSLGTYWGLVHEKKTTTTEKKLITEVVAPPTKDTDKK